MVNKVLMRQREKRDGNHRKRQDLSRNGSRSLAEKKT